MKKTFLALLYVVIFTGINAQKKVKVLFIGDSYTSVNNLPQTVANIALGNGDTLVYDSNTPGGTDFQAQCSNATTLSKIAQGGWDYVVLQDQSEEPAFDATQVAWQTLPYAHRLDSLIHVADSCTLTVFYLTWGHQNGDPPNCPILPNVCTYAGMQDALTVGYTEMAQLNQSIISPVGEAWRNIVDQHLSFDLYSTDSSHPSIYGTYLAASVFYEVIFQKSVLNDTYRTAGIADSNAQKLRLAAHTTVSDSLSKWYGYSHRPMASFTSSISGGQANFVSTSIAGETFEWNFGDSTTGSGQQVTHTYMVSGTYTVTLTVHDICRTVVYTDSVSISVPSGIRAETSAGMLIYPNPTKSVLYIDLDAEYAGNNIAIINSLGEQVRTATAAAHVSMPIHGLPAGVYTVRVSDMAYPLVVLH